MKKIFNLLFSSEKWFNQDVDKKKLRVALRLKRKNFDTKIRQWKNKHIQKTLENNDLFRQAKTIFTYVSLPDEVDTQTLIKKYIKKKDIIVPKVLKNRLRCVKLKNCKDLQPGTFDILEPKSKKNFPLKKIDLALIPGIAFDRKGHRIGYGKGYYDRLRLNCPKIGLAYDFQITNNTIPLDHDVPVDLIITDREIIHPLTPSSHAKKSRTAKNRSGNLRSHSQRRTTSK